MDEQLRAVAAGIKIQFDTWHKRNRATNQYAESRIVRQTAVIVADECLRKNSAFPYEDFLRACGVTEG